jgi:DNA-directed RNA polymerase alpha subunit
MITKEEFLKALDTVNNYKIQVTEQYEKMKLSLDEKDFSHLVLTPKTKVIDSGLSFSSMNVLKACDIYYLGEMEQFKRKDFLLFRNIGKKKLAEIEKCLFQAGIVLAD